MMTIDLLASLAFLVLSIALYCKCGRNRSLHGLPLPPGPKKLPLIGNLLDMPKSAEWKVYHQWCKHFNSDIIHLNVAGTSIIVLDSFEAATDLLEKRSSLYSSRPRMPMINELMGWSFNVGFLPYGDHWRRHRKLVHQEFMPTVVTQFWPQQLKAAHDLLRRLIDEPDDLVDHIRHMAGTIIISVTYGLQVSSKNDPYIVAAKQGVQPLSQAVVPGAFLVDAIPALKYVPSWMPFAGFQRKAREWRKLAIDMQVVPYEAAKEQIETGHVCPSFVSRSLEKMDQSCDLTYQEHVIKSTAGTMYAAGADTTTDTILSGILGLLCNPKALKKAQMELDTVVGHSRLPDFSDYDSLPYIKAVAQETIRWRTAGPIAIPHLLVCDDIYKGYRIPAGSIVVPNVWAMFNNEAIYPDPLEFKPERFINDDRSPVTDPRHAGFGFGRRICPGRHLAFYTIWIAMASIIAAFNIEKTFDEKENVTELSQDLPFSQFKCGVRLRSSKAQALIRDTVTFE